MTEVDRAARRLRRMRFVDKVVVHEFNDAAAIHFLARAPPDADVPPRERGEGGLQSAMIFSPDGAFVRVLIRYPILDLDRYGGEAAIRRRFDALIARLDPDTPEIHYISSHDETTVPHFKSGTDAIRQGARDRPVSPVWSLDDALDFTADSIAAFNDEFYPGPEPGLDKIRRALGVDGGNEVVTRKLSEGTHQASFVIKQALVLGTAFELAETFEIRRLPDNELLLSPGGDRTIRFAGSGSSMRFNMSLGDAQHLGVVPGEGQVDVEIQERGLRVRPHG